MHRETLARPAPHGRLELQLVELLGHAVIIAKEEILHATRIR